MFCMLPLSGWGQSLITDPFDYVADGTNDLVAQSAGAWSTDGSGTPILVVTGSLSYPGLAASSGNRIEMGGNSSGYYRNFTGQASGTVYVSFLLKVTALPTGTTGDYFIYLGNATAVASPVYLRASATTGKFNLGLGKRNNLAVSWLDKDLAVGQSYFLEFAMTYVDGTKNDVSELWVDPAPGSQPAADISISAGGDITVFKNMNRLLIAHGGDGNGGLEMDLDELRVTTQWVGLTAVKLPAAPTALMASAVSSTSVDLDWKDNAADETGYQIERSEDGANFTTIKTVAADVTSYSDLGLTASTKYYYRVLAMGTGGNSDYSDVAEVTTQALQQIPAAPSGLFATDSSATAIDLGWADNALNETGFEIDRSTDGTHFTSLVTLPANTIDYQDAGLNAGTAYYYRVLATGSAGNSGYSNVVLASTAALPGGSLIEEPFNYAVSPTLDLATQSADVWTSDGSGDAILLGSGSLNYPGFLASSGNKIAFGGSSSLYYHGFAGQEDGTVYVSFLFNVKTLPTAPTGDYFIHLGNATAVAAPVYLRASETPGKFNIGMAKRNNLKPTWLDGDLDTGKIYFMEFAITYVDGAKNDICKLWLDPATEDEPAADISITSGADITVFKNMNRVIIHHGADGNQGLKIDLDELRVTTQWVGVRPVELPEAPDGLVASAASSTSIKLSWADHADNETGFEIERSADGGSNFVYLASVSANTTSYTDLVLVSGTRYDYRVRAKGKDGYSEYSNVAGATPELVIPKSPTDLSAVAAKTSITLNWTDNSNNEIGFGIERSADGKDFTPLITVAPNTISYVDAELAPATTFYYRVVALGRDGNSSYSDTAEAKTPEKVPESPSGLAVAAVSATTASLIWEDNSDDEMGFQIERSTDGIMFSAIDTVDANTVSFLDTALMPETKYYYRVIAVGANGNSGASASASTITDAAIPASPEALAASAVSSDVIVLSWEDHSDNETWFELQRSTDGSNFTLLATVAPNTVVFRDSSLEASTDYYYRVRATGIAGSSDYSNIVKTGTLVEPHDPVHAANLLTPNGDGKNDRWIIEHIMQYKDNQVSVFDRSGRMVFHQEHYANNWTGLFRESPLPTGAYYYDIRLGSGYPEVKGMVTIIQDR